MSMLETMNGVKGLVCGESKTKQKVGVEHDINKIVARFKKTGEMPNLTFNGTDFQEDGNVIDLTQVGDYQECQNRIAGARELFDRYPAVIRRRFNNKIEDYMQFMTDMRSDTNKQLEALSMGILQELPEEKPKETPAEKTTVIKDNAEKK